MGTGTKVARMAGVAFAAAGAWSLTAARPAAGEPPTKEVAAERYNLSPAYAPGYSFRVETRWKQTTMSYIPQGLISQPASPFNDYDGALEIDSLVTVEQVDSRGGAEVYTVRFDKFRAQVPDPVQSKEYRDRVRERKQKHLPEDAHPLEGATIRYDASGAKPRIYRVLEKGEDPDVTKRYPEVVPVMQDLVDPDWTPVDAVAMGGEWEMNADHLFRLTRVVARAPIKGTIRCRLVSVVDGIARLDVTAKMLESYAKVDIRVQASGRIEFDIAKRRQIGSSLKGEVTIGGERTGLRGTGTFTASKSITEPQPVAAAETPK